MRRALTIFAFIPLILSAWDAVAPTKIALDAWARLRSRHRPAPDAGWDRFYGGLAPRLVMPGPDADYVVVYGAASAAPSLIDVSRYTAVQAFEDEFTLYRRSGR